MDKLKAYRNTISGKVIVIVRDESKGKIVEKHRHRDVSLMNPKFWEYDVRAIGSGWNNRNEWETMINLVKEGDK